MAKYIIIEGLKKIYTNKKIIFDGFDVKFELNKIHCLLGMSGCGKSTLLRIIAGIEDYEAGNIDLSSIEKKKISMIMQENNLLPWFNIYNNIKFALNSSKKVDDGIIDQYLIDFKLYDYKKFYPYQLSVGLKQKVSFAKSLVTNPNLILLDEPFCALDYISKEDMHTLFLEEYKKRKFTAILSTHFIDEAIYLADYIHLVGKNGQYKKVKNPLKKPRNKDDKYQEFLEFIKNNLYR